MRITRARKKDIAFTISITKYEARVLRHLTSCIEIRYSCSCKEPVHRVTQELAKKLYDLGVYAL
jgi:hypothetical protein